MLKTALIQKAAETMGSLIGNKIADTVTNVSKRLPQNQLEIVDSEKEHKEITKERYIPPEKRQQIVDDLRLV